MKVKPKIHIVYENNFPTDFVNDLDGWSLSKNKVESSKGKLIHLDIDFGINCSLNCPMCFRKNGNIDKNFIPYLDFEMIKKTLIEAKALGLEAVRILGAGEPFEEPNIMSFLEWLNLQKLKTVVFTQGHTITEKLAEKLAKLNVSIMLRYDSFDDEIVNYSVGRKGIKQKKDKALEILCSKGFNKFNPTHLGIVAPVTRYNFEGILEIYKFFRDRNIYPLIPFIACAGRSLLPDGSIKGDTSKENKIKLATQIYKYNFKKRIPFDGVSAYIGTHICTFLSNGFYLTLSGVALRCEGDEISIIGDLRKNSISEIWQNSQNNLVFGGKYNYGCPPKAGKSIPHNFYRNVEKRLKKLNLI